MTATTAPLRAGVAASPVPAAARLDALAGMRFACILVIVARHYALYLQPASPAAAAAIGRLDASEFFFFASGYLRHASALRVPGRSNLAQLWRQLVRLYPLHLATTLFFVAGALALGINGSLHGESLGRCLVVNLALLQAWGLLSQLCLNFPSWFLSAIFGMYLVYPALARLVAASPWAALALLVALVAALEWLVPALAPGIATRSWLSWTFDGGGVRALPSFLGGVLLAQVGRGGSRRLPTMIAAIALLVASLVALVMGAAPLLAKFALQGLALAAVVFADPAKAARLPGIRPLAEWDAASFPLFLLHAPVAAVLMNVVAIRVLKLHGLALVPALIATAVAALVAARLYAAATRRRT